jgi:hypothetical protein
MRQPATLKHPQTRDLPGLPVPPTSDSPRPATVASRLPPANKSARRIDALVDNDNDHDDSTAASREHGDGKTTSAQADLPHSGNAASKLPPTKPAKVSEKEQKAGSRTQPTTRESPVNPPADGVPEGTTPAVLALFASLQAQMLEQEKRLAARERADKQDAKRRLTEFDEIREEQLLDQIKSLQEVVREKEENEAQREQERREETSCQPFAALQDPEYLVRFESLMKVGQRTMAEVAEALQATKERGGYSSGRADVFLKAKETSRMKTALQAANCNLPDDQEPIADNSKLGAILQVPGNEDAVDIVTKLRDVHARARPKTAHSSTPALAAGNLVGTAIIKNDASMGKKGLAFLSSVAYAVCEDCQQCTELRNQAEKEREWKAKQAAEAESIKKAKSKAASKRRLVLPFKPADSRLDKSLPRGFCGVCTHGYSKGHYLYLCHECKRGIHLFCTDWNHLRLAGGGPTWFACNDCLRSRDLAIEEGNASKEYVVVEEEFDLHELAPSSTEAAGNPAHAPDAAREDGTDLERRGSAAGGGDAPPPRSPHHNPPYSRTPSLTFVDTPLRPSGSEMVLEPGRGNHSRPSYQVKDYFTWEMVPKDWAPKADAPSKVHPEKGYSRVAYQNWRRKNVTLRDQVEANESSLGPLTRSFSGEMRAFIGKQFLKEPALSWLWPHPVMSEKALDTWVATDPEFKWVEKIPDPILLELMDKRFGVRHPDLFLSRKFYSNLPVTDSYNDVNYHADLFNRWAGEWSTELMELQKAGVSFENVDLKQTLLNAVAPYKVIHDKAVQIATTSANVLLAALCDWVIEEEEKAVSRRNQKESLLKVDTAGEAGKAAPSLATAAARQNTQQQTNAHSKASAAALMTHLGASTPASGDQGSSRAPQRLPSHLKANGNKVFCRGCSNNWDNGKSIPCYKGCKYLEHPEYFPDCKDKEPPTRRNSLTWRGYRDRNPSGPFPQSFLRWEEYERTKGQKRPRDEGQRNA